MSILIHPTFKSFPDIARLASSQNCLSVVSNGRIKLVSAGMRSRRHLTDALRRVNRSMQHLDNGDYDEALREMRNARIRVEAAVRQAPKS